MALRAWIMAAIFIGWNGLLLSGLALNGWRGRIDEQTPLIARVVTAAPMLTLALMCLAILTSAGARAALFAPERRVFYAPDPYVLIMAVNAFLGVFVLFGHG